MTAAEKNKKIKEMQDEAKDLQARLGFLGLQRANLAKEETTIRAILEYQESKFSALQQSPTEEPPAPEAPKAE